MCARISLRLDDSIVVEYLSQHTTTSSDNRLVRQSNFECFMLSLYSTLQISLNMALLIQHSSMLSLFLLLNKRTGCDLIPFDSLLIIWFSAIIHARCHHISNKIWLMSCEWNYQHQPTHKHPTTCWSSSVSTTTCPNIHIILRSFDRSDLSTLKPQNWVAH